MFILIALAVPLIYWIATFSDDPLQVNIIRAFAQLLVKYLPGVTAPLRPDLTTGTFKFDEFSLTGQFTITQQDIEVFDEAVRSEGSPFFLVAKTTPLVIRLLADRRCPIKPIGAVNSRNVITFVGFYDVSALMGEELAYVATFGSRPGIRRKRGVEFVIAIDVLLAGNTIVKMELWMLQFLPNSQVPRYTGTTTEVEAAGDSFCQITMTPKDPRLWARSCKDYNPIHVSGIGARLFGFKSVIAHGNHAAALVLQKLDKKQVPYVVEEEFLRPMLLPGRFEVLKVQDADILTLVGPQRKPHMRLVVRTASDG